MSFYWWLVRGGSFAHGLSTSEVLATALIG